MNRRNFIRMIGAGFALIPFLSWDKEFADPTNDILIFDKPLSEQDVQSAKTIWSLDDYANTLNIQWEIIGHEIS